MARSCFEGFNKICELPQKRREFRFSESAGISSVWVSRRQTLQLVRQFPWQDTLLFSKIVTTNRCLARSSVEAFRDPRYCTCIIVLYTRIPILVGYMCTAVCQPYVRGAAATTHNGETCTRKEITDLTRLPRTQLSWCPVFCMDELIQNLAQFPTTSTYIETKHNPASPSRSCVDIVHCQPVWRLTSEPTP